MGKRRRREEVYFLENKNVHLLRDLVSYQGIKKGLL